MSQNKLSSLFKQIYGMTLFDYIQELRVKKAKELLQDEMTVKCVAQTVGYKRHSSFTEMFKQKTGITPLEFKQTKCDRLSHQTGWIDS